MLLLYTRTKQWTEYKQEPSSIDVKQNISQAFLARSILWIINPEESFDGKNKELKVIEKQFQQSRMSGHVTNISDCF